MFEKDPFTKDLSLGVLDVHSHAVEAVDEVRSRIRRGSAVLPADRIWDIFSQTYLAETGPVAVLAHRSSTAEDGTYSIHADARVNGEIRELKGTGNGPISAFGDALADVDVKVRVIDYVEHSMGEDGNARAAAYVEAEIDGRAVWGVGIHSSITTASLKAMCSAIGRA